MIYDVMRWFEREEFIKKWEITNTNLFETACLSRYSWQTEITYDQGSYFIGRHFRKSLIEKQYGRLAKPTTSGNASYNVILEYIHMVLANGVRM